MSVTLTCVSGKTVSGKVGGATTAPVSCVDGSIVSSVSLTPTVCAGKVVMFRLRKKFCVISANFQLLVQFPQQT